MNAPEIPVHCPICGDALTVAARIESVTPDDHGLQVLFRPSVVPHSCPDPTRDAAVSMTALMAAGIPHPFRVGSGVWCLDCGFSESDSPHTVWTPPVIPGDF